MGASSQRSVRIAGEGALLGPVIAEGVALDLAILSEGAEWFDLLRHAACWVSAERQSARAIPHNEARPQALEQPRDRTWDHYRALKAYRQKPQPQAKSALDSFAVLQIFRQDHHTALGQSPI